MLEAAVVVAIVGLLVAIAIPKVSALRDASSVHAAMSEVGATFATARASAIAHRAAVAVVFDTSGGNVLVRSAGQTLTRRGLSTVYGVSLGADRDSAVYDPRGLGYGLSNLSVTIRRGTFIDTLTMSRLGRVRW